MEIKSGQHHRDTVCSDHLIQRFTSLLARLSHRAECVVVAAPPISEAAETQILCAAADGILLVVDASASRVQDAAESVRLLEAMSSCGCATHRAMSAASSAAGLTGCRRSKLIGTVLIDGSVADSGVLEPGIGDPAGRRLKLRMRPKETAKTPKGRLL